MSTTDRLSPVGAWIKLLKIQASAHVFYKSSLKKIMTMLGRVRRRQEDEDPTIRVSRPAKTSRTEDYYKAVMIQSQRLRLEYASIYY